MKTTITSIGNSKGVRIPSAILQQCGFEKEVTLQVRNQQLIISPANPPRADWEQRLSGAEPSELLIDDALDLDDDSWQW